MTTHADGSSQDAAQAVRRPLGPVEPAAVQPHREQEDEMSTEKPISESGYRAALQVMRKGTAESIALTEKAQAKGGEPEHSYHAGRLSALRLTLTNLDMILNLGGAR